VQVFPRERIRNRLLLVTAACVSASIPFLWYHRILAAVPLIWAGGLFYLLVLFMPRYWRRRRIASGTMDETSRRFLEEKVSYYRELPPEEKKRYEDDIEIFIAENRITGVDSVEITREIELLVAATAVRLVFRRPEWEYRDFGEILVYPGGFRTDGTYSTDVAGESGVAAGMVHSQGSVILSLPHLLRSFEHPDDGFNVGYHEFAHVLDGTRPDGIPDELKLGSYKPWVQVMQKEFEKVHRHRSVLRDYAGTNPAEFFAVAVETFFEKPHKLREKAPELYDQLSRFFNQNPDAGPA
jgi:Mlc titration factor MtfA (ptsG expression regulator)